MGDNLAYSMPASTKPTIPTSVPTSVPASATTTTTTTKSSFSSIGITTRHLRYLMKFGRNILVTVSQKGNQRLRKFVIIGSKERVCSTSGTSTTRSPNSVHIVLQGLGEIKVDNRSDVLDICKQVGQRGMNHSQQVNDKGRGRTQEEHIAMKRPVPQIWPSP